MRPIIDPDSPIPIYHQIAESIRAAIEAGTLAEGDGLVPLREAARQWGVNLHTVRHAYTSLVREGLLEVNRGGRGTRVAVVASRTGRCPGGGASLDDFLDQTVREAMLRHRLTPEALVDALRVWNGGLGPRVYVVECSRRQAECHSDELKSRYRVDAVPWLLQDGEPPAGTVVATYFHYNDIRRHWPHRLGSVRFLAIHPNPDLRSRFGDARSVWVCELEADTASAVAADLSALFEVDSPKVRIKVAADPNDLVPKRGNLSAPHLFAPRAWAALTEAARQHPKADELGYVFDTSELLSLALKEDWLLASTPQPQETQ